MSCSADVELLSQDIDLSLFSKHKLRELLFAAWQRGFGYGFNQGWRRDKESAMAAC